MTTEISVQIVTLASVIAGYLYTLYREKRNRQWDLEDRQRTAAGLASTVLQTEQNLAQHTQYQQDQLMSKIEQNTAITKQIHAKANDTQLTVAEIIAKYDAIAKREPKENPEA